MTLPCIIQMNNRQEINFTKEINTPQEPYKV